MNEQSLSLITPLQAKEGWSTQGKAYLTRSYGLVLKNPQRPRGLIVRLDCILAMAFHRPTGKRKALRHTAIVREIEFTDNAMPIVWAENNAGRRWPCHVFRDPWAVGWRELFADVSCSGNHSFAARILPFFDPTADPTPKGKQRMAANRITEEAVAFSEYAERAGKGMIMERLRRQKEPRDILRMDKIFAPAAEATVTRVPNRRGVTEIAAQQDPRPEILGLFTATDAWSKAMQHGEYKTGDEEHRQPKG